MSSDNLTGHQAGNYTITRKLGEGGMGAVYLGRHPEIGLEVAIKVLSDHLMADEEALGRFIAEAKALSRVNHPNVVRISDFGHLKDGRQYFVMEALEGRDLGELLRKVGTLTAHQALTYVEQICAALQAAHERGIIHRDLKPDNVFVLDGDPLTVKILDFGLAKLLQSQPADGPRTALGMVMGTPRFVAPEQAAGDVEAICPQTDLYSLGVVLYIMLCGEHPTGGASVAQMLSRHITATPLPLRQVNPEVPAAVASLVHHCLAKQPEERPASAAALAEAYRRALAEPAGDSAPPPDGRADGAVAPGASPPLPQDASADELALGATIQSAIPLDRPKRSPGSTTDPASTTDPGSTDPASTDPGSTDPASSGLSELFDKAPSAPVFRGALSAPSPSPSGAGPAGPGPSHRTAWVAMLVVLGLAGVVGAGALYRLRSGGTTAAAPAADSAAPAVPATNRVSVQGPRGISCTAAVGRRPAAPVDCTGLDVARGEHLSLTVLGPDGARLFAERWPVEADRTIRLAVAATKRSATRRSRTRRTTPPARPTPPAAAAKQSTAALTKQPAKASDAKAPRPPAAKAASEPKRPRATDNIGPRVMDID